MAEKKVPYNPFSAGGAAAELQSRKGKTDAAIEAATASKKAKKTRVVRKKEAPSVAELKKTKHKGSEGEVSFGQRMGAPVMGQTKTRFSTRVSED